MRNNQIRMNSMELPHVIATRKNEAGIITDIKLSDGRQMTKEMAINEAKAGRIEGVNVGRARDGREILRGNPTDTPLSQLSEF